MYDSIKVYADLHPKPVNIQYQYGTAGFRTLGALLESVIFRVGVLAALRSKKLDGKTIGVVVTASHNPEQDNGVKLVDPRGEMLESAWEGHATTFANAPSSDAFIVAVENLVEFAKIDVSKPAKVVYARDTRPTGPLLIAALEDGLKAIGAEGRNEGVKTTPVLHYLVRCINSKGTDEEYGVDSEDGYMKKLSGAFRKLVTGKTPSGLLIVDCANGVGAPTAELLMQYLGDSIPLKLANTAIATEGALNNACGADYVKTSQKLPPSLSGVLRAGQRACSLDGDADRLIYYYMNERNQFRLLDGDKIAALVAAFIVDLVKLSGLEDRIDVGVVQTAYANGASTKYLSERLPVKCVPTGVKHLHHAAEHYSVGVYFEANGHGTVLFSSTATTTLIKHRPSTPAQQTALNHLINLTELINQTVGDALSDMLLVEVVLAHKSFSGLEWDSLYSDLPNRLVKVVVKDRNIFKTEDAERRLVSPPGLQQKLDELIRKYDGGRSFVRPSGTEDVVRVYAEAILRPQADELAFKVAGLVYDSTGGDPMAHDSVLVVNAESGNINGNEMSFRGSSPHPHHTIHVHLPPSAKIHRMCRLLPIQHIRSIDFWRLSSRFQLLTKPCHSIINQAFNSRLRVDRRNPINGDGFGVGWYDSIHDEELGSQPCIFTSVTPAWNNVNLTRLAEKIKSPLVFAHVRATTAGSLSLDNCHPFVHNKLMFMHNGGISEFLKIKRRLQTSLSDDIYNVPSGNTDSEWAFALFLSKLPDANASFFTPATLKQAMLDTIASLNEFAREFSINEVRIWSPSNKIILTRFYGETVVATRYISSKVDEAASLWFSSGTTFSEYAKGGHYKMSKADKRENIIMVASEPLTFEKADWMEIRTNNMIVVTPKMNLLQIPIVDEFYVPPSDPASLNRTTSFAEGKGLLNPRRPI
ncbi:hypothetical protein EW145_g799 [Phellinidium pouzarii]|uniref:phosphoacetylglucosamine mutase n=1 Tax=Phellinidium pouzarii TaxID=167371 RepID=A0A4S4LGY1_9AGAM|nr:hypothetical protein EW145_g799 [Phellinidium pouzarii]